jgi:hypothetical protein
MKSLNQHDWKRFVMELYAIFSLLTPWTRVLLEKLVVCSASQRNSAPFMEPEGLLPCSQEPTTGPSSDSDESNPHPPDHISPRCI